MASYVLRQSGGQVQSILDNAAMRVQLIAETERAQTAEQQLQTNIDSEATARQQAVANEAEARASAVAGEASARQQADTTLQQHIDAEQSRAEDAEGALQTAINSEAQTRQQADGVLDGKIAAEKTRAEGAEGSLQTAINNEAQARQQADGVLDGKIAAEKTRAEGAEGSLQTAINNEAQARQQAEGALDVSELNATENPHTLAKYVNLSAAIAAIPTDYQKGGMSIKYVQSSDNKYVQFRCVADEFTTDTTQWAVCDDGVYVESLEFIKVCTDNDGRILYAIKADGSIYWGAGIPQQVIDYIEDNFDEYDDVVTFLGNLINGDKTLTEILSGMSYDIEALKEINVFENSNDYIQVIIDGDGHILFGIKANGEVDFPLGVPASIRTFCAALVEDKQEQYTKSDVGLCFNVFGDVLPSSFKEKLVASNDDILVVCQGDSITGLIHYCKVSDDPTHDIPSGIYQSFTSLTQKQVGKVKPYYNRLDSTRDNVPFYSKTGTWLTADSETFSPEGIPAISYYAEEASRSCKTYRSNSVGASIGFVFDSDNYDKCNIIFSKNRGAGSMVVTVQEGDGKLLASLDRDTWVEANGFSHSQATIAQTPTNGEAECMRHRRLWLKKVAGTSGMINVTYSKVDNDDSYVYCWGTEMYKGRGIFIDNIGRGGKTTTVLSRNISDIFERNPDLTIMELAIANDLSHGDLGSTEEQFLSNYRKYFVDDADYSYKRRSNNYTTHPIIIMLPHCRDAFFDNEDNAILGSESQQKCRTVPAYDLYKKAWAYIHQSLSEFGNVSFLNLGDQYLNEAKYRYGSWHEGLAANNLTYDGIHLNQLAANIYAKYISSIFLY